MSSFRIIKLETANRKYKIDERTGLFEAVANNGVAIPNIEKSGLLDILLTDLSIITEAVVNGEMTLKLNDLIDHNEKKKFNILKFSVVKNRLIINNNIDATSVSLYKEPEPVKVKITDTYEEGNIISLLQDRIDKNSALLKLGDVSNPFVKTEDTLEEFIANFLTKHNIIYHTTYKSSDRLQTTNGKRRSIGDIYMICKTYFPDCTLRDVFKFMYITLPTVCPSIGSIVCGQINKRVWWIYGSVRFSHSDMKDEYGYTQQDYITELNKKPKPVQEKVDIKDSDILSKVKTIFTKGTKVKSLIDGKTWVVDSDVFYDGLRSVILVTKSGSRKIIYDKNKNKLAEIVK